MRPKIQKSIKTDLGKNGNLFIAEVINFPKDNSNDSPQNSKINNNNFWKLYDKANVNEDGDQLKAVIEPVDTQLFF